MNGYQIKDDQEAYELARAWVTREGASQCRDESGSCVYYRSEDGNRCAIGGIMDENTAIEYEFSFECATSLPLFGAGKIFEYCHSELLDALQNAHDNWDSSRGDFSSYVSRRMDHFAEAWGLEVVQP